MLLPHQPTQPPQHRRVLPQREVVDVVFVLAGGAVHRPGVHHVADQRPPLIRGDYRGVCYGPPPNPLLAKEGETHSPRPDV